MTFAHNGPIRLFYEAFGKAGDPVVLLMPGAGRQGVDFGDGFCQRLAGEGWRVIRFDPRDTGLSSAVAQPSRLIEVFDAVNAGAPPPLAYGLDAMADDAFSVLDAAGVQSAHLLGRSLGSAVAQAMALSQPDRVLSLTLVMAFSRSLAPTQTRETLIRIESEQIPDVEAYVERQVRGAQMMGSPAFFDAERVASEARIAFERGVHAGATARHFAVGVATRDMRSRLEALRLPALVIHGALDRVIPSTYAEETVAALNCGSLHLMQDMGHDGPPQLVDRWASLFLDTMRWAHVR